MSALIYCTLNDVKDRLSDSGVDLRLDDNPPTAADGNVLARASRFVDGFLLRRYTSAKLATSDWVIQTTATVAAYYLCVRRGNPSPGTIAADFEDAKKELKRAQKGYFKLPDIGARATPVPQLSNAHIQNEPSPRTVIERQRSTSTPEKYAQRSDLLHPEDALPP